MPKPSVSARPDYRAARTRARRAAAVAAGGCGRVCWRWSAACCWRGGPLLPLKNALDALFLDEPVRQLPADTPASVSDRSESPRLEPEGGLPAQTDAREALEDYLAQLPAGYRCWRCGLPTG